MPRYDYRCKDCRKTFDVFMTYAEYGQKPVVCSHCKSTNVVRRINKVRIAKSDASRMEAMADPNLLAGVDEDPRALGKMMRGMKDQVGEEMAPEFDEVVGRLEAGQTPEQIENDMPDFAAPADDSGGMGDLGGLSDL